MKKILTILLGSSVLFAACGEQEEKTNTEDTTPATPVIEVADVPASPEYDGAKLAIANVKGTATGDSVKVAFDFKVENYELKTQTADADSKNCNNSDQGQHIHFILDNKPYTALYEPKHEVTLEKNSEHYLMAFLSRSYHESVKTQGAALVYHFKVDENGKVQKLDDPTTPMVFYSRPKGDYVGAKNTDNLLFDYYVWNTTIGADGNHVLAHIKANGVDTTMNVNTWKAQFLRNMPMGKPSITLTLVDKDGNKVDGPMTEVTREFTLAAEEPLPAQ